VLHTCVPRCFDEVAVAFQIHALRVVRAAAHGGVGRRDYGLDVFDRGLQRGAVAKVPMHRLCTRLHQLLGRRGKTMLDELRRGRVATYEDAHLFVLLQQPSRDHAAYNPRSTDYQDHSLIPLFSISWL
jgi:hypothetical protein